MISRPDLRYLALIAILLILVGCAAGPQLRSNAAPGYDFSQARTFAFFPEPSTNRAGYHSIVTQQLMFSSRREMELRGLEFVDNPEAADLLINFHTQLDDRIRVRTVSDPWVNQRFWDHRNGWYQPWPAHRNWPQPSTRTEVQQTTEGSLNVDIIDARSNMLVWEGIATQRVTARTLNGIGPALDIAVHEIFSRFPLPVIEAR